VTGNGAALRTRTIAWFGSRTAKRFSTSFEKNTLDAAFLMVTSPRGTCTSTPKLGLRLVADYVPREHWNVALAVRAADATAPRGLEPNAGTARAGGTLQDDLRRVWSAFPAPRSARESKPATVTNTWRRSEGTRQRSLWRLNPTNLPYSSAKDDRPGLDVELAKALAEELHLKLRLEWIDVPARDGGRRAPPGSVATPDLGEGPWTRTPWRMTRRWPARSSLRAPVLWNGAISSSAQEGVRTPKSLEDLKGAKVPAPGDRGGLGWADYSLRRRGFLRSCIAIRLATLKALNDRPISTFAYLWANVRWTLHASRISHSRSSNYALMDQWNHRRSPCAGGMWS